MLTNNDLGKIKKIIHDGIKPVQIDVTGLKIDVKSLKTNVKSLEAKLKNKNFVKAIDVKQKLPLGKDHKLNNLDVVEIKTSK